MLHMSTGAQAVARSPRSNIAMFVDMCKKQLRGRKKRKGSASSSTVSLEPLVCSNSGSAGMEVSEVDGRTPRTTGPSNRSSLTTPAAPLVKSRSSSDISTASTVALDGPGDNSASTPSLYEVLEKAYASSAEMREFVRQRSVHPAGLMDDFVDFVAHQIVHLMNEIVKYNDAFNDARNVNSEGRALKKEFVFYSLVNSNLLPTFNRITKLINQYSQAIVCDVKERYGLCETIQKQMDVAKDLISNTMGADDFFENARKDKHYLYAFIGSKVDNLELPVRVRRSLLGYELIHDRASEWFRRIPNQGAWK